MEKVRKRRNTGRVTLQDVAKHAGVGSMTVSRALRTPELVSDKLRQKIEQAVEELGYVPNLAAGMLASGVSRNVAVLVPSLTDHSSATFLQALQEILNQNNYQVLIGCHEYNQHKELEVLNTLLHANPAALVIFGNLVSEKSTAELLNTHIPIISIAGYYHQPSLNIDSNIEDGAYFLAKYMLDKGYKNIGYIGAQMDNKLQNQQLSGWAKAMLHHYHSAEQSITTPYAASMQFGRQAITEMLTRQPELDGVICSHEVIALGIMFECQRRLLKIPASLAVACLEGTENCDHIQPTLTSIRIDYRKIGREAGKKLTKWLSQPVNEDGPTLREEIIFPYRFEPRQSA
ncbi:LacI family DNA-binding transcriptional regulator [Moellerella wisconsensis]|uniref:LacI family DNA-binding transcriptional regulator n=1 Tax=Moellerella wisconsensis TaxID=158849 RepID=UPI000640E79D|nr:LacI family DNA-binding transcriptional regulator [Moellerella wisconsensis]KLN96977.1 LacI family transcriptional regulator [Moellerella wisconsensis]